MVRKSRREACGLFRSVGADGSRWLFAILADGGWAITRDGEPIAAGTSDRASLQHGVDQFVFLTRSRISRDRPGRLDAHAARDGNGAPPLEMADSLP